MSHRFPAIALIHALKSNLIVRAKHEIVLATNFWKESRASQLITDALRELSKRAGQRGQNVVVKILFDRGSVKQVWSHTTNHK